MKGELKFLDSKKNIRDSIELDKVNLTEEEYKYLKELLNLKMSFLKECSFSDTLDKKDYYISLALFNLCQRNFALIKNLDIDQEKIEYYFDSNTFFIKIKEASNKLFYIELNKIYNASTLNGKMYQSYFCSSVSSKAELLEIIEDEMHQISSGKVRNSDGSFKSYREREFELLNLSKKLVYVKENGDELVDIYSKVNETLKNDYGLEKAKTDKTKLVRSLSFIDIYERGF